MAYRKLLSVTSLVILDIKEIDPDKHLWLTGKPLEPILGFARLTADVEVPIWVRHVVVPTVTDNADHHYRLGFLDPRKTYKPLIAYHITLWVLLNIRS